MLTLKSSLREYLARKVFKVKVNILSVKLEIMAWIKKALLRGTFWEYARSFALPRLIMSQWEGHAGIS